MIKTKIKFLITIIIFALLMIPNICDATETLTYENFNYHIEINNKEEEYIVIDSLIDTTVEELRIPATINGIRVAKFVDPIYDVEVGAYTTHILNSAPNLKKLILEKSSFVNAFYYLVQNTTIEEIVIEEKKFDTEYSICSLLNQSLLSLKTVYGYGNTRLKNEAENAGYTYISLGDNSEKFIMDTYNPTSAAYLNVAEENLVIPENISKITFVNRYMTQHSGVRTDQFSSDAAAKIKTLKFETKDQIYVYDQAYLTNVETVYGYTGTGAENVALNIAAEFISLGTVEEVSPFLYEIIDNSYVKITGLRRVPLNVVEFPEYIENLPVEVISYGTVPQVAFGIMAEQEGIVIPKTVKKVEGGAFDGMYLQTVKVLSKDIEYLDDFNMLWRYSEEILCNGVIVYAYDESGMLDVVKKDFPQTYADHYVSLNKLEYTTKDTEDITVDEKEITIMPIDGKTNVKDFIVKENFPIIGTYTVKVLDATKTNEKTDTDKIGSRNIIQIIEEKADGTEKVLAEYLIILNGDVNGDGNVQLYDSFQILKGAIIPSSKLDTIDTLIRDFNNDGFILLYDAFQFLKKAIIG